MSMTSSEISVAESEGVPDGLHGSRSDTFSIELGGFNRLDVSNLGTIGDEIDHSNDGDYIEQSSPSSDTSEYEIGASVVSFESHSNEGGFVSRQNTQMRCASMLMLNRGIDDSLGLLSISSTSSCETQIIYRPPMRNASLVPPHTSSNFVDAVGHSVGLDVHGDKEASAIESTSIGVTPVDSVDNSAENHVSLRKKMKNRICSFSKRAWKAMKHPSLCCETRVEPYVPPPADAEPADPNSSCPAEPSGFKPTDESEEFGYEMGMIASEGFSTVNEETPTSNSKQTEDANPLDEFSLSSDTSEDECGEDVIGCGPFSVQRGNPVHRLGEWSFNSDLFIGEGGSDDNLDLLSISSGTSSTEERSGAWQNVPARETCTCSDCRNMYATGPSMSLEAQSDKEASPVDTVENSTEKHTNLWKKMKNGISSIFKKARKALKCSSFCCCCCETRVEPFVPQPEDLEPDPQSTDPRPFFVAKPFGFKPTDEFYYEMAMWESGGFGFL